MEELLETELFDELEICCEYWLADTLTDKLFESDTEALVVGIDLLAEYDDDNDDVEADDNKIDLDLLKLTEDFDDDGGIGTEEKNALDVAIIEEVNAELAVGVTVAVGVIVGVAEEYADEDNSVLDFEAELPGVVDCFVVVPVLVVTTVVLEGY